MFFSDDYPLHSICQALVYYLTLLPRLHEKKIRCTIVHVLRLTLITCYTSIIFHDFFIYQVSFTIIIKLLLDMQTYRSQICFVDIENRE